MNKVFAFALVLVLIAGAASADQLYFSNKANLAGKATNFWAMTPGQLTISTSWTKGKDLDHIVVCYPNTIILAGTGVIKFHEVGSTAILGTPSLLEGVPCTLAVFNTTDDTLVPFKSSIQSSGVLQSGGPGGIPLQELAGDAAAAFENNLEAIEKLIANSPKRR